MRYVSREFPCIHQWADRTASICNVIAASPFGSTVRIHCAVSHQCVLIAEMMCADSLPRFAVRIWCAEPVCRFIVQIHGGSWSESIADPLCKCRAWHICWHTLLFLKLNRSRIICLWFIASLALLLAIRVGVLGANYCMHGIPCTAAPLGSKYVTRRGRLRMPLSLLSIFGYVNGSVCLCELSICPAPSSCGMAFCSYALLISLPDGGRWSLQFLVKAIPSAVDDIPKNAMGIVRLHCASSCWVGLYWRR